jgi:hypothetical protein
MATASNSTAALWKEMVRILLRRGTVSRKKIDNQKEKRWIYDHLDSNLHNVYMYSLILYPSGCLHSHWYCVLTPRRSEVQAMKIPGCCPTLGSTMHHIGFYDGDFRSLEIGATANEGLAFVCGYR